VIKKAAIAKDEVDGEDAGSVFELNNWNLGVRSCNAFGVAWVYLSLHFPPKNCT